MNSTCILEIDFPEYVYVGFFALEQVFILVAFTLYFLECRHLAKRFKQKFSSFAALFILTAVTQFGFYLSDIPIRYLMVGVSRSFLEATFLEPSFLLTPVYFLQFTLMHTDFYLAAVISLTRTAIFYLPMTYEKVISRLFPFIVIFVLGVPAGTFWYLAVGQTFIRANCNGYSVDYIRVASWVSNSRNTAIVVFACAAVVAVSSALTTYKFFTVSISEKRNEKAFLAFAAAQSITLVLMGGNQLGFYFNKSDGFWFLYNLRRYISDICIALPPWTLLVMSSDMREYILVCLCCCVPAVRNKIRHGQVGPNSVVDRSQRSSERGRKTKRTGTRLNMCSVNA